MVNERKTIMASYRIFLFAILTFYSIAAKATDIDVNLLPGVDPTGVSDSAPALQTAINSLPNSGGTLIFCGDYNLASGLVIGNGSASSWSTKYGVALKGCGAPLLADQSVQPNAPKLPAARLKYSGGSGGSIIKVQGPLSGFALQNLFIDGSIANGTNYAGACLETQSISQSRIEHVSLTGCSTGFYGHTVAAFTGAGAGNSAAATWHQTNVSNLSILVPAVNGGTGVYLDSTFNGGTDQADLCCATFETTRIVMASAPGVANYCVYFGRTDSIAFKNIDCLLSAGATARNSYGFLFDFNAGSAGINYLPANHMLQQPVVSEVGSSGTTHTFAQLGTPNSSLLAKIKSVIDHPVLLNGDTWTSSTAIIVNKP